MIKRGSFLNNNFCLIANGNSIEIGENCFIGVNFQALNSDFHALSVEGRNNREFIKGGSIFIGKDCFIGNNVSILKGVSLGSGCVVGHSSVVTQSFADNSLIAGNPARFIRVISENQKDNNGL